MTFKITLAYDGTPYVGWQRQARGVSVQALLEDALSTIAGGPVRVVGAGRTDAGVHALGQVASAELQTRLDGSALGRALNALLPPEIRVVAAERAPDGFNARYGARAKTYRYRIRNAASATPFDFRYSWWVTDRLDDDAMRHAARAIEGRHDFAAFQSSGSAVKTTTRTIAASVLRRATAGETWAIPPAASEEGAPETLLIYDVTGDGFLRHMVRAIVGTLVEIGCGRRDAASMASTLASRDRAQAGPTAPPHGLFLVDVRYDGDAAGPIGAHD